ncbi:MAG: methyltransferase domain-containing protein [Haliea sp.]|uniref:class I SAM-dependent methyltransferase n=1 Tax=Haliea sp. TaxID=1932666 RepID=UPI0032EB276D
MTDLECWYATSVGRAVQRSVAAALEPILETAFGYHLLQVGLTRQQPLFDNSRIRHRAYAAPQPGHAVTVVSEHAELPLESDSIDVAIAHHCLDFTAQPHQVLRELQRVLTPHGQLLLIGFNPWGVLGASHRLRGLCGNPLWQRHQPVGCARLLDWLRLLGCETESARHLCPLPVLGEGRLGGYAAAANGWSERHRLPVGDVYLIHAIKQVGGTARPVLRARRSARLIGLGVPSAAPTPRQGDHAA